MKHIYSDLLVAYLFNEIEPDVKQDLEKELAHNKTLQAELKSLEESLAIINKAAPLSPDPKIIENILEESSDTEPMLAH